MYIYEYAFATLSLDSLVKWKVKSSKVELLMLNSRFLSLSSLIPQNFLTSRNLYLPSQVAYNHNQYSSVKFMSTSPPTLCLIPPGSGIHCHCKAFQASAAYFLGLGWQPRSRSRHQKKKKKQILKAS